MGCFGRLAEATAHRAPAEGRGELCHRKHWRNPAPCSIYLCVWLQETFSGCFEALGLPHSTCLFLETGFLEGSCELRLLAAGSSAHTSSGAPEHASCLQNEDIKQCDTM